MPSGRAGPLRPAQGCRLRTHRGKVKSIYYEREALLRFAENIPLQYGPKVNIHNSGTLNVMRLDFKAMVEDKWNRYKCDDP